MTLSSRYRWMFLAAIVATLAMPNAMFAAEPTDEELLAGADARIEQCRKADATVVVVDAAGKPVAGAKIDVEQTRHAFLFGCNIFSWGKLPDEDREQAYRQRFAELLNYATLPFYWSMYEPRQGSPMHAHAEEVAQLVPRARNPHERASLGLEPRRSRLASQRPGRNPSAANGPHRRLREALPRADRPLGRGQRGDRTMIGRSSPNTRPPSTPRCGRSTARSP